MSRSGSRCSASVRRVASSAISYMRAHESPPRSAAELQLPALGVPPSDIGLERSRGRSGVFENAHAHFLVQFDGVRPDEGHERGREQMQKGGRSEVRHRPQPAVARPASPTPSPSRSGRRISSLGRQRPNGRAVERLAHLDGARRLDRTGRARKAQASFIPFKAAKGYDPPRLAFEIVDEQTRSARPKSHPAGARSANAA